MSVPGFPGCRLERRDDFSIVLRRSEENLVQVYNRINEEYYLYQVFEAILNIPEAAQPIHQFRHKDSTDWYDMDADEQAYIFGDSDFVTRTVYTAPTSQEAEEARMFRWLRENCHHNEHHDRDWPHAVILLQWRDRDLIWQARPDQKSGVGTMLLDTAVKQAMAQEKPNG